MVVRAEHPPRIRAVSRLTYKEVADRRCRRRVKGSPRLLQRLVSRLSQARHLYLLNIWDRGGVICKSLMGKMLRVHRGKKWRALTPSKWHKGSTLGAFGRTRKIAAFKSRAANKKKKKVSKGAQMMGEMKIMQYRALQLGQKRRTSTKLVTNLESTLRAVVL